MARLTNFLKLLKFIWDHSADLLAMLEKMQTDLFPVIAGHLRNVAGGVEGAAGTVASAENAIGDTLCIASDRIGHVGIPVFTPQTSGFYDMLVDSLNAMHIHIVVEPDQQTRDRINQVRVLGVSTLPPQDSPFEQVTRVLETGGEALQQEASLTITQWNQAAQGLRLLADVFDPPNP